MGCKGATLPLFGRGIDLTYAKEVDRVAGPPEGVAPAGGSELSKIGINATAPPKASAKWGGVCFQFGLYVRLPRCPQIWPLRLPISAVSVVWPLRLPILQCPQFGF